MYVERLVPDKWLFGDPPLRVTSVGVLVHTGELKPRGYPWFLLVQQADQPDSPWGIPAGRVEINETESRQTGMREVMEETGMSIQLDRLREFVVIPNHERVRIVYAYQARRSELSQIGDWEIRCQSVGGTGPYAYTYQRIREKRLPSNEIGDIILLPYDQLFDREHPVIKGYYRWDSMHHIKARLEGLRVI